MTTNNITNERTIRLPKKIAEIIKTFVDFDYNKDLAITIYSLWKVSESEMSVILNEMQTKDLFSSSKKINAEKMSNEAEELLELLKKELNLSTEKIFAIGLYNFLKEMNKI